MNNSLKFFFIILAVLFTEVTIPAQSQTDDESAMLAASKCDVAAVKKFFGNNVENKSIEEYKGDMLSVAVEVNCTALFEFLLSNGVDVNFKYKNSGDTALHTAALFGRVDLLKRLLASGADINAQNDLKWTPLRTAILNREDDDVTIFLIDNGADLTTKDENGNNLLMDAAMINDIDLIKVFLIAGIKINAQNNSGFSAITYAACGSDVKLLKELILLGADVNLKDGEGRTPLMWAAFSGKTENVKELLASGANINDTDENGKSALMYSAEAKENSSEIINLLRKSGAL